MLSWRASDSGSLHAAYTGSCRIGYVFATRGGYTWQLCLLRPAGGHHFGKAVDLEDAKRGLESDFTAWLGHAQLMEMTNGGDHHINREPDALDRDGETRKVPRRAGGARTPSSAKKPRATRGKSGAR